MNIQNWVDGELLSSVRNKIISMFTAMNTEGNYLSTLAPASPVAGQIWTNVTDGIVYQRDTTNSIWKPSRRINGEMTQIKTASYTAVTSDFGSTQIFTGGSTLNLPAYATLPDGWYINVKNASPTVLMAIKANGTQLIDGYNIQRIPPYSGVKLVKYQSGWTLIGNAAPDASRLSILTASIPTITTTIATQTKYNMTMSATNTLEATVTNGEFIVPKTGKYNIYTEGRPVFQNASGGVYGVYIESIMKGATFIASGEVNFPVNGATIGLLCKTVALGIPLFAGDSLKLTIHGWTGDNPYGSVNAHTVTVKFIYAGV